MKNATPEEIVLAVRRVAAGDVVLDPTVTAQAPARVAPKSVPPEQHPALSTLTDRERAVFVLVAQGLTNAEIATRLHIGEATVKTHISRVLAETNLLQTGSRP